jgi:transcriptional regulator with XRE-family HTH domain
MKDFPQKTKTARKLLSETMSEFAERFDASVPAIHSYETGRSRPRDLDIFEFVDKVNSDTQLKKAFDKYQKEKTRYAHESTATTEE